MCDHIRFTQRFILPLCALLLLGCNDQHGDGHHGCTSCELGDSVHPHHKGAGEGVACREAEPGDGGHLDGGEAQVEAGED